MNSDGGATTVCALTASGTIFCWGDNTYGQTGLAAGTATQSPGPELVHP